ncbi:MAG TPA: hypothetical protein VK789_06425 [Bryobacteraceae bacterium]|nr:hypothetical protein [Bryobacteraceae bacterium]
MIEIQQTIERFLQACTEPVLCEPGEESLVITADNFVLESRNGVLSLQAWDDRRNLVRRVTGIEDESHGKLVLRIERFAKRAGTLSLVDLRRTAGQNLELRSTRLEFRELFRRFLRRQFPAYKIAQLTTEADLEHSLSPAYPRALLRQGTSAWAAIGASPDPFHSDGALTFGLIWLDYLRQREPGLVVHGLILYLPAGREKTTCLRLLFLDPRTATYDAFVYTEDAVEQRVDLRDYGNLDTRLEPCRRRLPSQSDGLLQPIRETPGVEIVERADGEQSLRVRGLEFARTVEGELLFGLEKRRKARSSSGGEIRQLAVEISRFRCADAGDRLNPLYLRNREAWLESRVRSAIEEIDARLLAAPIYDQVPAFAAADRGVLDLLALERDGRLAVIELKATEDIHLPLQALDYWMRVKWHLDRREFTANGYFPGTELLTEPPRLLLVSPALDFHPSNEGVLRYFAPHIEVERIGVGLEWRKELKVVFRSAPACLSKYSKTFEKPSAI